MCSKFSECVRYITDGGMVGRVKVGWGRRESIAPAHRPGRAIKGHVPVSCSCLSPRHNLHTSENKQWSVTSVLPQHHQHWLRSAGRVQDVRHHPPPGMKGVTWGEGVYVCLWMQEVCVCLVSLSLSLTRYLWVLARLSGFIRALRRFTFPYSREREETSTKRCTMADLTHLLKTRKRRMHTCLNQHNVNAKVSGSLWAETCFRKWTTLIDSETKESKEGERGEGKECNY